MWTKTEKVNILNEYSNGDTSCNVHWAWSYRPTVRLKYIRQTYSSICQFCPRISSSMANDHSRRRHKQYGCQSQRQSDNKPFNFVIVDPMCSCLLGHLLGIRKPYRLPLQRSLRLSSGSQSTTSKIWKVAIIMVVRACIRVFVVLVCINTWH